MPSGDARDRTAQNSEFARQHGVDDAQLGGLENSRKTALLAGEGAPGVLELHKPFVIDRYAGDNIEPFVASGAGDAEELRHWLAVSENLFDDHLDWTIPPIDLQ